MAVEGEVAAFIAERKSLGKVAKEQQNHPIMTGIRTLFEGITVCYPTCAVTREWVTLVQGGTLSSANEKKFEQKNETEKPQPLIVVSHGSDGRGGGRVVLDMGYTKLWKNWNKGGTDRYVCNATAWLTSIDRKCAALPPGSKLMHDPFALSDLHESTAITKRCEEMLRKKFESELANSVDFTLIIDLSGSMTPYFDQARDFALKVVDHLQIGSSGHRLNIIGFGTEAHLYCGFGQSRQQYIRKISEMKCLDYTVYSKPLHMAARELRQRKGQRRSVILFQTDGANSPGDNAQAQQSALTLKRNFNSTIYGVVVNDDATCRRNVKRLVGNMESENGSADANDFIRGLSDYGELVRSIGAIMEKAISA